MAIIQISKIQQRSGNLVDLPQLDDAQFGWASDEKKLFIGKTLPNENIEVLTSYSNINYSQLVGSEGNLNIVDAVAGEVLSFDGINWVNKGATAGGLIDLGTASNVKIAGGGIGYVLETDGTGNLSWSPKGTIIAYISNVTKANPAVVTTLGENFLSDGAKITVTDVGGMTQLNGNTYYINVLTSSTFALYTDIGLTVPVDSTGYTTYTTGGRVICTPGAAGGSTAGGANTSVQFNNNNLSDGDADFTYDYVTNLLTLNGNANVGNLNATGVSTATRFVSNIATGTAPFTVSSTTKVTNLNADLLDGYDSSSSATNATIVLRSADASIFGNIFYGNGYGLSGIVGANVTGAVAFATTANAVAGANVSGAVAFATTANAVAGANVSGQVANALVAGTVYTAAQPNITSVGTLSSVTVTANTSTGGIKTDNYYYANGASISFAGTYSNSNVASYLPTFTGTVGATALTTGANTTAGTITGNWSLSAGSKLNSTYADLAEYYEADTQYEPGTVLEFGGDKEVTVAEDGTTRVAGVVSTNPAYAMNQCCKGFAVAIALQGRVPTKVRGTIRKGDMMISAGNGFARPWNNPQVGMVIGKALENFDGVEGVIEVAVGRL